MCNNAFREVFVLEDAGEPKRNRLLSDLKIPGTSHTLIWITPVHLSRTSN